MGKNKKTILYTLFIAISLFSLAAILLASSTDGTIDGTHRYAWGENVGWIDFGTTQGNVHISDNALTGYAFGENIGWISLNCSNTNSCSTVSYKVANNGEGSLAGYAWSENVGWINWNPSGGGVTINSSGDFSGYAWGENIGWINLSGTNHKVRTDWRPVSARQQPSAPAPAPSPGDSSPTSSGGGGGGAAGFGPTPAPVTPTTTEPTRPSAQGSNNLSEEPQEIQFKDLIASGGSSSMQKKISKINRFIQQMVDSHVYARPADSKFKPFHKTSRFFVTQILLHLTGIGCDNNKISFKHCRSAALKHGLFEKDELAKKFPTRAEFYKLLLQTKKIPLLKKFTSDDLCPDVKKSDPFAQVIATAKKYKIARVYKDKKCNIYKPFQRYEAVLFAIKVMKVNNNR